MRQTRTEGAVPRPQTPAPRPVIKPQPKPVETAAPVVEEPVFTAPVEEAVVEEPVFVQTPVEPAAPEVEEPVVEETPSLFENVVEDAPASEPAFDIEDVAEPEDIEAFADQPEDIDAPGAVDDGEYVFNLDDLGNPTEANADEDFYEEDEALEDEKDPNPFDSMLSIFRNAFGKLKRGKADESDLEDDQFDDLPEDSGDFEPVENPEEAEPAADDFSDEEPLEEAPAKKRFGLFSRLKKQPKAEEEDFDFDDSDFAADDYEAEEFPEIEPEEDAPLVETADLPEDEPVAPVAEDVADIEDLPAVEDIEAPADIEDFEDLPAPAADIEDLEDVPAPAADIEDLEDLPIPEFKDAEDIEDMPAPAAEDIADLEDLEDIDSDYADERPNVSHFEDESFEDEDFEDEDFEDEDFDDDLDEDGEEEDNGEKKPSALRRFLSLFIVREDDEPAEEDGEEELDEFDPIALRRSRRAKLYDEEGWKQVDDIRSDDDLPDFREERSLFNENTHSPAKTPVTARPAAQQTAGRADDKGGIHMDEKNRVNTDMTELLAAGLESQGMSRRERRELAARQAAAEAAKRAAEEAKLAEETRVITPIFVEEKQPVVEEPAVEETPAETSDIFSTTDEPTRIFKPVSPIAVETPVSTSIDDDDEDEDEDEEEEIEEKRGGFGLFRKKQSSVDEDEDDEEDDEDDYDDDDDEEDDEEEEKKPRRGLFGKKNRSVKYDEDDEEDDEEDEDDEYDEYDDYDDDDDDDEDDYDDDDDDDGRSIGHRILGFFKGLLALIVCVLVVVIALNFLDYFNVFPLDSIFEHHYNKAPAVFDTLFPSHSFKQMSAPSESITAITPLDAAVTPVPTDAPAAN